MNLNIERTLTQMEQSLRRIADALDADRPPPNYRYTLDAYPAFDWTDLDAEVIESDDNGAARVSWRRHIYTRRSNPKYGRGVWFSRGAGRDEEGNTQYERLVTFASSAPVEPLPAAITKALTPPNPSNAAKPETPAEPTPPPAPKEEPSELDRYFPRNEEETPAATESDRKRFYRLLPVAIAAGLEPGDANSLTAIARRTGYPEALATLEKHIARLEDAPTE